MRLQSPRARWLPPLLAIALAAGFLGALSAPAQAAHTTANSTDDVFIGDAAYSVSNGAPIPIPTTGPDHATLYPSTVDVTHNAVITDVEVFLNDVTHSFPDDLDIMLVGPNGRQVLLMSDAGGNNGNALTDVDITFDDEAAAAIPDSTVITAGTYRPANYVTGDLFDAPAPATNGNTSLSVFDGTSPVGAWSLYVMDDSPLDGGDIAGWSLRLGLATSPYPTTINVTGAGTATDVNVSLQGLTSTFPDDHDFMLVGPAGQQATILSDAGGDGDVTSVNLTFDDEAAAALGDNDQIVAGTYKPTNIDPQVDPFPLPAPVSTGNDALSVFDGTNPNGQWKLFVTDDLGVFVGSISGWSLDITWSDTKKPVGSVSIDGDAASTKSKTVTLSLDAQDGAPSSGVKDMRFSNDGKKFSAYQPYAETAPWTLSAGDGVKTVYAQFRDADGNESKPASSTITLKTDFTGPKAKKLTPKKDAKGVAVSTKVTIKVSEKLDAGTVTAKKVFLEAKGSSTKVDATVKYNAKGKSIVLTPKKALKSGTTYTVTVKGIKDVGGNAWDEKPGKSGAQALKFSFTTA